MLKVLNRWQTLFIKVLFRSLLIFCSLTAAAHAQTTANISVVKIDLSAPEKSVHYFYQAFRTGNADLLSKILIEGGSFSEFNPQYKSAVPNPFISDVEITRKAMIKKWGSDSGEPAEVDDVLIYAINRKDPRLVKRKPGISLPDEKFCFLNRKIDNQWKIVKVYSGWPTFINH